MSEVEWLKIFGDNLNELIGEKGVTQSELAEETGLSESSISYYMHKTKMPGVKAIINLAYALNCSIDELIDFGESIE